MLTLEGAAVLLLPLLLLSPPPSCSGSECTCNITNSRCDEAGVCRCDPGWEGERCERCVPTPGCVHGTCQQPWQCSCRDGWGGRFCDKDLQACARTRPCRNGATCVTAESGDYACLCAAGFHGRHCQLKAGPCHQRRSPCKNGGLCEDADGFAAALTCACLAGFTGPHCETDVDDCAMRPCANGATCLDGVNRFSCVCPHGFSGRFCTVNLDDCASQPCRHGARCLDRAGGFRCLCRPGFRGATCETPPSGGGAGAGRRHDDRQLKVTVSERGAPSPSRGQLLILLPLGGATLVAVALTAALVLRGRCGHRGPAPCGRRTPSQWREASPNPVNFLNKENKVDVEVDASQPDAGQVVT